MSFMSHRKIIGQKIAEETDRACNDFQNSIRELKEKQEQQDRKMRLQSEKHRQTLIKTHQKLSPKSDYHGHKVSFINTARSDSVNDDPLISLEHMNDRMSLGW